MPSQFWLNPVRCSFYPRLSSYKANCLLVGRSFPIKEATLDLLQSSMEIDNPGISYD